MDSAAPRRLKRSDRARQMREAQRRRRERLRQDNRRFLQIILPEDLRLQLYDMSERSQQTLQDCVLNLIQRSLADAMIDDKSPDSTVKTAASESDDVSLDSTVIARVPEESNPVSDVSAVDAMKGEGEVVEEGSETGVAASPAPSTVMEAVEAAAPQEAETVRESGGNEAPVSGGADEAEKPASAGKRRKGKRSTNQMELF